MEEASFQFRNHYINKSTIEMAPVDEPPSKLKVEIIPSGTLINDTLFNLNLLIKINNEFVNVEVEAVGVFDIDVENSEKELLENFLYINAPAIIFPYIRAYISTLTTLSGRKPITLPTLNLTNIGEELKKNIEIIKQ